MGTSRDSLRLIRRNMAAMRAPQYQIVAVRGLFETDEQFQVSFYFIIFLKVKDNRNGNNFEGKFFFHEIVNSFSSILSFFFFITQASKILRSLRIPTE